MKYRPYEFGIVVVLTFMLTSIYFVLMCFRSLYYYYNCWGESFDGVSYKCATFNSSVKICDTRGKCSETNTMEYSSVVSYITWNTFTQMPLIVIGFIISRAAGSRLGMDDVNYTMMLIYTIAVAGLLSEAMQFSNYVLIFTLVGPANGFWATNTTIKFRDLAIAEGILTGINLALIMPRALIYCRSLCSQCRFRCSQCLDILIASRRVARSQQPQLALIRVEYEKALMKDSERGKIPTTIEIVNFNSSNIIDFLDELSRALQHLWKTHAHLNGIGKDAKGLAHSNMDIQGIRHVNNLNVLGRYSRRRKTIFDFTASVGGYLRNFHEYKTGYGLAFATDNILKYVDKRINEYYLFRGALSSNAESIAKYGFDVNKCKEGSMLGRGVYFTDNLVKADQYTKPDDSGMCCVIMARVLLGDFVVSTNRLGIPSTSLQPPCKQCMRIVCNVTPVNPYSRFDSVVYTGGLYKEFVVYENWQAYPEFIIFYKRL